MNMSSLDLTNDTYHHQSYEILQPQVNTWRIRGYQHILTGMAKTTKKLTCKRCNKNLTEEIICQSCKNELLYHFEASADWQMAFEMEKATLAASKYRNNSEDDEEFY
jgi:hypothetical protein